MKSKKLKRRLLLNKTTVADLNGKEMSELYGGAPPETHKNVCPPVPSTSIDDYTCVEC
ncbi:MAG: class I lanthipeptide [Candidatus Aminicenantes bacterium]|nr:class I lanthipeptide [Candidatus Aminicenantes bacterium]